MMSESAWVRGAVLARLKSKGVELEVRFAGRQPSPVSPCARGVERVCCNSHVAENVTELERPALIARPQKFQNQYRVDPLCPAHSPASSLPGSLADSEGCLQASLTARSQRSSCRRYQKAAEALASVVAVSEALSAIAGQT